MLQHSSCSLSMLHLLTPCNTCGCTGFVAEYSAQPFNRDGWGGFPLDMTATIEKDKTTTCLQAEATTSLVHSVSPFGNRHITQVGVMGWPARCRWVSCVCNRGTCVFLGVAGGLSRWSYGVRAPVLCCAAPVWGVMHGSCMGSRGLPYSIGLVQYCQWGRVQ